MSPETSGHLRPVSQEEKEKEGEGEEEEEEEMLRRPERCALQ